MIAFSYLIILKFNSHNYIYIVWFWCLIHNCMFIFIYQILWSFCFPFSQNYHVTCINFCLFRGCVHLPVCQDSPGAQTGRIWQGHSATQRKPKCKSCHTFCQRRRYQVRPGNSYITPLLRLEKKTWLQWTHRSKWEYTFQPGSARPLCNELQNKIKVELVGLLTLSMATSVSSPLQAATPCS